MNFWGRNPQIFFFLVSLIAIISYFFPVTIYVPSIYCRYFNSNTNTVILPTNALLLLESLQGFTVFPRWNIQLILTWKILILTGWLHKYLFRAWLSFYFPIWLSFFYLSALFSKIQTDSKWKQNTSRVDFFPHFYMPAENFSSQKVLLEFTHFACENIEQ